MPSATRLRFFPSRVARSASVMVISLLLVSVLAACGKKGPVRPQLATPAEAPTEVSLQQQGNLFVLGWSIPPTNQAGIGVQDLAGFRIKRLVYDVEEGCPTCRDPQTEVAELDINSPAPGQRIGTRLYWRDLDEQLRR